MLLLLLALSLQLWTDVAITSGVVAAVTRTDVTYVVVAAMNYCWYYFWRCRCNYELMLLLLMALSLQLRTNDVVTIVIVASVTNWFLCCFWCWLCFYAVTAATNWCCWLAWCRTLVWNGVENQDDMVQTTRMTCCGKPGWHDAGNQGDIM